jgi:hypothetical protein
MVEFDSIKVKDQLGRPEDKGFTTKRYTETVIVEEGATTINRETIGNSFILGHSTNGVLGIADAVNDEQIVLGEDNRVTTLLSVTNPNNVFKERFDFSTFDDTGSTTADWNVGDSGILEMTNGEIAQSLTIAKTGTTWTRATMSCTFNTGDSSDGTFQLSADGGINWETVTLGTEHTFTNTGTDLRFKITASDTVDISEVRISYS